MVVVALGAQVGLLHQTALVSASGAAAAAPASTQKQPLSSSTALLPGADAAVPAVCVHHTLSFVAFWGGHRAAQVSAYRKDRKRTAWWR